MLETEVGRTGELTKGDLIMGLMKRFQMSEREAEEHENEFQFLEWCIRHLPSSVRAQITSAYEAENGDVPERFEEFRHEV